jgi:hypothetical protein
VVSREMAIIANPLIINSPACTGMEEMKSIIFLVLDVYKKKLSIPSSTEYQL